MSKSDYRNENSFYKEDQITGYATVDSATAITWDFEEDTTLNFQDVIIGSVYFEETGSTNGFSYSITLESVEILSGDITAGSKALVKINGYVGKDLQVLLNSTSAGNSATATVRFYGK